MATDLPDYIEIAYSHITRSWGVTCTACPHKMRNAGATEDAAAHVARMHLDHDHSGWNTTA
ncbi:hypothetical protein GCM10023224_05440 [Streptomonospora halophila]|uniref:BED-type domain-containing protein n=1 Tax=Streptomonospora halophila TaxID=427369 RepID=A0ABP9G602_9ACTN